MNIRELTGHDPGMIGAIFLIAFLCGVLYAIAIHHSKELIEGYTSLAVVAGVLMTLALSAFIIGIVPTLLVIAVFVCTGAPMIVGEIIDYNNTRRATGKELSDILREHGNGNSN